MPSAPPFKRKCVKHAFFFFLFFSWDNAVQRPSRISATANLQQWWQPLLRLTIATNNCYNQQSKVIYECTFTSIQGSRIESKKRKKKRNHLFFIGKNGQARPLVTCTTCTTHLYHLYHTLVTAPFPKEQCIVKTTVLYTTHSYKNLHQYTTYHNITYHDVYSWSAILCFVRSVGWWRVQRCPRFYKTNKNKDLFESFVLVYCKKTV